MIRMLVVMLLLGATAPVDAQPAPQDRREKIKQRIRALRAYTLTEQLSLDEATAAKLFPALAKFDDEFDKLLLARTEIQRRLDGAGSLTDPKQVDQLIDEAVVNQKALWDTEDRRLAQLRKILTPAQTARVLVVLPAIERKIQGQLKRAAQRPGAPAARAQPPATGGELTGNPFDKSTEATIDPFSDPRPQPKHDAPRKKPATKKPPCDPFGNVHGCDW